MNKVKVISFHYSRRGAGDAIVITRSDGLSRTYRYQDYRFSMVNGVTHRDTWDTRFYSRYIVMSRKGA